MAAPAYRGPAWTGKIKVRLTLPGNSEKGMRRMQRDMDKEIRTVPDILNAAVCQWPDAVFLWDYRNTGREKTTFSAFMDEVLRLTGYLIYQEI